MLTRLLVWLLSSFYLTSVLGRSSIQLDATNVLVSAILGKNNISVFECWKMQPPFTISSEIASIGAKLQQIGDVKGASLAFFNESSETVIGLHNAPKLQWVAIMNGHGTLTLPTTGEKLALPLGSLIVASDTASVSTVGHNATFAPGTILMYLPFAGGTAPNYTVVNEGPCRVYHHKGKEE